MDLEKENIDLWGGILLIFSSKRCVRKHLPVFTEGSYKLLLFKEDVGLCRDVEIELACRKGLWFVGEKRLDGSGPYYFYTESKEKLLLLLSKRESCLRPAVRVAVRMDDRIAIGNAFKNPVFYDCFSLIKPCYAEIIHKDGMYCESGDKEAAGKGQGYRICSMGNEGVYVNEEALDGERELCTGDRVDIYGLHLMILKNLIICVSFNGVCRAGRGKSVEEKAQVRETGNRNVRECWVERNCAQEEELHTGEMEVIPPQERMPQKSQPFILSVGPAITMVLPVLLMAQAGSHLSGETGSGFYYMSVIMTGCSALLALFWGAVGQWYQKYDQKQERRERERQYREYLRETEKVLLDWQNDNRRILEMRYPPAHSFLQNSGDMPLVLWNRYYRQKDFLFLRLGTGDEPFQMKIKFSDSQKRIVVGKLAGEAQELAKRYLMLKQVPIGINLYHNRQIGMVGGYGREGIGGLVLQLLAQIAICHCYTEIKIACFYNKNRGRDQMIAGHCKWMPHSWSRDKQVRYLAGDERETGEILPYLTRELTAINPEAEKKVKIPWYIVFILEEEWIRGEPLYGYLTDSIENYPVSAVFVGEKREELPKSCRCFLQQAIEGGEILDLGKERISRQKILPEVCGCLETEKYLRKTAGLKVREAVSDGQLPETVSFLDLFGCSQVEELESGRRWKLTRPEERLKVPIGVRAGGNIVNLDVHEKFHGPHGLIAGTTGSGKSELIQTYLLSIAVSFSPLDVNFFMIDYKGGGTGNALKSLPHCAGVISNLSGRQIKRAMSAITSENKRRQKLLGSYQVNHIDGYTRLYREGKAIQPMPHLLLVVDEFAELKKEEPEFMQEIISLAQVGRSLGVHLILATQKPAGTVDDKIWSNARFRLCLKVQDKQDSMDMLHNGDAASLTLPGQCYLQIGNHEYYEQFQSGYCGGIYRKEGVKKAKAALLSNTGKRWERKEADSGEGCSQMEALVNYVCQTAKEWKYPMAPALWLPELPEKVLVEELRERDAEERALKVVCEDEACIDEIAAKEEQTILIGLCDDPENQKQPILGYYPCEQGHLAVCGGPSTGKSTLLKTILWQLCSNFTPDEMIFLIIAVGQEEMGSFNYMPHCLGILKEKKDKDVFFYHLKELTDNRKRQLGGVSCERYNRKEKEKLPLIFVFVDDYAGLRKILDENKEDFLTKLAAEGLTLGIYLVMSAAAPGEFGGKIYEKVKTTLALEMSDRFQYGDILRQYFIPVFPKENQKGRGLCRLGGRVLEFQTALIMEEQEGEGYLDMVRKEGKRQEERLHKEKGKYPCKFPMLPKKADFKVLLNDFNNCGNRIPIGYDLATAQICSISLKQAACFLISGRERTGRTTLLGNLAQSARHLGYQTVIVDMDGHLANLKDSTGGGYLEKEESVERWQQDFEKGKVTELGEICVFITNLREFCRFLYQCGDKREERTAFWEQAAMGTGRIKLLAGIYHPEKDYETAGTEFFREFAGWQQGVHLGGNTASQRALSFDDLSYAVQNQYEPAGIGYLKEGAGSRTRHILLPGSPAKKCQEVI